MGGAILLDTGGKVYYFRAGMVEGFVTENAVQMHTIPMMMPDGTGNTAVVGGAAKIYIAELWVSKDNKMSNFQCLGSAQRYETKKPEWWGERCK